MKNVRWKYVLLWALLILSGLSLASYSYRIIGLKKPLENRLAKDADVIWSEVTKLSRQNRGQSRPQVC